MSSRDAQPRAGPLRVAAANKSFSRRAATTPGPGSAEPEGRFAPPAARPGVQIEIEVLEVLDHHVDVELAATALARALAHAARFLGIGQHPRDRVAESHRVLRLDEV